MHTQVLIFVLTFKKKHTCILGGMISQNKLTAYWVTIKLFILSRPYSMCFLSNYSCLLLTTVIFVTAPSYPVYSWLIENTFLSFPVLLSTSICLWFRSAQTGIRTGCCVTVWRALGRTSLQMVSSSSTQSQASCLSPSLWTESTSLTSM